MDRQDRQNIAVALVVLVLIAGTYWLLSEMKRGSQLEDCLMQRRRNCDALIQR
ncbi:hypothetical protein [uncultured Enterovirga sp.]|uniref:hypothetical protein n=1 Tax=uncultured Enterovirga sp. TaxID=2026352 RepID=UPI0035CAA2A3